MCLHTKHVWTLKWVRFTHICCINVVIKRALEKEASWKTAFSCCALSYEPEAFFPTLSLQARWWELWFTQAGSCAASWTPPIQSTRYSSVRRSPSRKAQTSVWPRVWMSSCFIDCVFWRAAVCVCRSRPGSDHTSQTMLKNERQLSAIGQQNATSTLQCYV